MGSKKKIWWVVRLRGSVERRVYFTYLICRNRAAIRRGTQKRRQWRFSNCDIFAFRFTSLSDARRSARSKAVLKCLNGGYDMVEILMCSGSDRHFSTEVVERPGVSALVQLAMESR